MKNVPEALKNLPPTSETGRYKLWSPVLEKWFWIEPISDHPDNIRSEWGDVNPATKKVEGDYGDKHKGGVKMKDSVITEENGFKNPTFIGVGVSPAGYIMMLEEEYLRNKNKSK